jgi:hypothetical protein
VGIRLAAVGEVETIAVSAETVTIALAPNAVAMGTRSGGDESSQGSERSLRDENSDAEPKNVYNGLKILPAIHPTSEAFRTERPGIPYPEGIYWRSYESSNRATGIRFTRTAGSEAKRYRSITSKALREKYSTSKSSLSGAIND